MRVLYITLHPPLLSLPMSHVPSGRPHPQSSPVDLYVPLCVCAENGKLKRSGILVNRTRTLAEMKSAEHAVRTGIP